MTKKEYDYYVKKSAELCKKILQREELVKKAGNNNRVYYHLKVLADLKSQHEELEREFDYKNF
jgi:hypothetical protein